MITGCGEKTTNEKIIGKWLENRPNVKATTEFLKDGTITVRSTPQGKWLILQDGLLKLTLGKQKSMIYTIVFDGDQKMIITDKNGTSTEFIRQGN